MELTSTKNVTAFTKYVNRYMEGAFKKVYPQKLKKGYTFSSHSIRATKATHLYYEYKGEVGPVASKLGHSKLENTELYIKRDTESDFIGE